MDNGSRSTTSPSRKRHKNTLSAMGHKRSVLPWISSLSLSVHTKISRDFICDELPYEMITQFKTRLKRIEQISGRAFWIGMFGVITDILQRELIYADDIDTFSAIAYVIRSITTVSTIILLWYIFLGYQEDFGYRKINRVYLRRMSFWNFPWTCISFIIEAALCGLHTPPGVNLQSNVALPEATGPNKGPWYVQNIWSLIMVTRIYLIVRYAKANYYTGGTRIVGFWNEFRFHSGFAMRNWIKSYPAILVFCLGYLIVVASYCLLVCERANTVFGFQKFGTAFWIISITVTTVGYGDIAPVTECGRFVTTMTAFTGILITSIAVGAIIVKLNLQPHEARMVEFLEFAKYNEHLKDLAANCISSCWRLHKVHKSHNEGRDLDYSHPYLSNTNYIKHRERMFLLTVHKFSCYRTAANMYRSQFVHLEPGQMILKNMLYKIDERLEHLKDIARPPKLERKNSSHVRKSLLKDFRRGRSSWEHSRGSLDKIPKTQDVPLYSSSTTTVASSPTNNTNSSNRYRQRPGDLRRRSSRSNMQPSTELTSPRAVSAILETQHNDIMRVSERLKETCRLVEGMSSKIVSQMECLSDQVMLQNTQISELRSALLRGRQTHNTAL